MKVTGIVWDTYGEDVDLPTEVEVPDDMDDEDDIADYLCDRFGYCIDSLGNIEWGTREVCVSCEVTAIYSEYIKVPKNISNSEVEDWLEKNGKFEQVADGAEEAARCCDFNSHDFAITDECGRDIKPWG